MDIIKFPKAYFVFTLIIFLIALALGVYNGIVDIETSKTTIRHSVGSFGSEGELPNLFVFLVIFLNNTIKCFLAIFLGVLLGLFPIYFIVSNAMFIGLFAAVMGKLSALNFFFAGTLPHGILELTAVILAASYGIWLGGLFFQKWIMRRDVQLREALKLCWRKYYTLIVPMLFVAALIETFITPIVINHFAK